jgi:hypothetical protein
VFYTIKETKHVFLGRFKIKARVFKNLKEQNRCFTQLRRQSMCFLEDLIRRRLFLKA